MLARDYELYAYMTSRGYAGARVDIRGTGASGGDLPEGEYTEQEQRDAEDVIAWLAAQPWCTGAVGMWGISWGGFNAIQVAMRRPPAPDYPLDEATLARRFDSEPWLMTWLARQQDGPYWRRASLRPDYGRLTVPAPVKIMIGPWNHTYPHDAVPGPAIEWRVDAVRWWDHWLKGAENGIMSEPPVTVYIRDWHPPDPDLAEIPGRWRTETAFPPERTACRAWYCGPERNLSADPPADGSVALRYVPSAGWRPATGGAS
jgi:uncharacterized protein